MKLTNKYRLIWDKQTKQVILDPDIEYNEGSVTYVNAVMYGYYNSQVLISINSKISSEKLINFVLDKKTSTPLKI